jgi:hypothetical protein
MLLYSWQSFLSMTLVKLPQLDLLVLSSMTPLKLLVYFYQMLQRAEYMRVEL